MAGLGQGGQNVLDSENGYFSRAVLLSIGYFPTPLPGDFSVIFRGDLGEFWGKLQDSVGPRESALPVLATSNSSQATLVP